MELGLSDKVALVTGSSRGIGRGIALALAREGCDLMLTGRDPAALEETAGLVAAAGRKAAQHVVDLRAPEAAGALVAAVTRAFGGLDILVNNAGSTKRGDFFTLPDADWQEGFALKFFAHVRLARAAWPLLKERRGSLLTISGNGARLPTAEVIIGAAVNCACLAFTKSLADIGKRDGVQVNAINPGSVETDRFWARIRRLMAESGGDEATVREHHRKTLGVTRFGTPEDVGTLVAFMVSPPSRWLHGATVDMDGGEVQAL